MKVVFNVNGKKVPLKSLQYISKANQLEVMRNWFLKISKTPQTLARMNPVKADMLTFMVAHMKQVKSYKRCLKGT